METMYYVQKNIFDMIPLSQLGKDMTLESFYLLFK